MTALHDVDECVVCSAPVAPHAGADVRLYLAPGVKLVQLWLPLCPFHVATFSEASLQDDIEARGLQDERGVAAMNRHHTYHQRDILGAADLVAAVAERYGRGTIEVPPGTRAWVDCKDVLADLAELGVAIRQMAERPDPPSGTWSSCVLPEPRGLR